ncbi:MAG: tyrosine-type recombinase/integrase [Methylophaga sp.]|nr:tyrosine-type recombinase/integrase [Methylophaga sp.]
MPLSDIKVKSLKAGIKPDGTTTSKPYRVTDEKGLYLEVTPKGGKRWRFKYRFGGKEKLLSVGTYPDVSLKAARVRRDDLRVQVADGVDPSELRKAEKVTTGGLNSFEAIAREWHVKFSANWGKEYSTKTITHLEKNIFPWLGSKNINDITPPELLAALRRIENRGALDTAHRVLQICGAIYRYAVTTGKADRNQAADLKGALPPAKTKHHSSITDPKEVGGLMRAIQDYSGSFITATALKLSPLLFVRPGELRQAEWKDIDLEKAEWRIPAEKMKMRVLHIVPLSKQAVEIFKDIQPLTGRDKYVFPSNRTVTRPMSNNTINAALRRLGFTKEEMTAHGFRSMASTLLNEQGWNGDAIERQLAHSEGNGVRAAYNYAQHLPERKKMMQSWADYLDGLATGADVIPINRADEG